MKKVSKISLHNLSKAELADKEMNLLRGGNGSGSLCVGICGDSICRCVENDSGAFDSSEKIMNAHIDTDAENTAFEDAKKSASGA